MKSLLVVFGRLLSVPAGTNVCPTNQPKADVALLEFERDWAQALNRRDADTVACMVADEFEDAGVDGSLHSRSQTLARIAEHKPGSNHLTEMRAHVEGNFGFVRGLNEVRNPAGEIVARVRFTDIFAYRDGRWQALAAQETLLGEGRR